MNLLLDTHVWFWYLTGSDRLAPRIRELLDNSSGSIWISPISVWELSMLAENKRVEIFGGFRKWVEMALERFPLKEAPLNREVALKSREIGLPHRDPADRFLAATALVYDLVLVTVDGRLTDHRWLRTFPGS